MIENKMHPTPKEPKHTPGHSIDIQQSGGQFLCPECGKSFESKKEANAHLNSVHLKHLHSVHPEYHAQK
jgi:uncharacterized C2H2 Zn-finger protein